jgi:hydrophobic/amphiphilic exporter-1 (mainly G- bacteria), HAE1 family
LAHLLGFSINLLTLFALVLAIGIVVDNAIVVVEAIHAKMNEEGLPPMEATIKSMHEIAGAIIAITLVMSAVFIPVAFLSGPVGVFYRQFSITLAIAIFISGINALTLTPALCAILLKPTHGTFNPVLQRFFNWFNGGYNRLENGYKGMVKRYASKRRLTIAFTLIFAAAVWGVSKVLPSGFIPTEDQGVIYVNVTTPPGSTVERTGKVLDEINQIAKQIPAVENISTLGGYSLITESAGASFGMAMINLKPWDEREESVNELIDILEDKTKVIDDAVIEFFPPSTVPGFGNTSGFEFRLIDKTGSGNLNQLDDVATKLIEEMKKRPEIDNAFTSFDPSFPQYLIHVDYKMAAKKDVSVAAAMDALQTLVGSYYASNFVRFGQMYKVMVQASPEYREKPEDILKLYVKNNRGEMVQYGTFIRMERVFGAEQITRYNMFNAIMINGSAAPGYRRSGQDIAQRFYV